MLPVNLGQRRAERNFQPRQHPSPDGPVITASGEYSTGSMELRQALVLFVSGISQLGCPGEYRFLCDAALWTPWKLFADTFFGDSISSLCALYLGLYSSFILDVAVRSDRVCPSQRLSRVVMAQDTGLFSIRRPREVCISLFWRYYVVLLRRTHANSFLVIDTRQRPELFIHPSTILRPQTV